MEYLVFGNYNAIAFTNRYRDENYEKNCFTLRHIHTINFFENIFNVKISKWYIKKKKGLNIYMYLS